MTDFPGRYRELSNIDTDQRPWFLGPYFILSAVLFVVTIAFPLIGDILGAYVLKITLSLLLFGALYAVVGRGSIFRVLGLLLLPLLAGNWLFDPAEHTLWARATAAITILFLATTTIAIFVTIISARRVTTDIIFGSVAIYLLTAVIVATLFQVMNNFDPGSVATGIDVARDEIYPQFLYFSFITLTSVGYGDFSPVSPAARTIATVTGVFGQLYLAILIAKLVGVYTAQTLAESKE